MPIHAAAIERDYRGVIVSPNGTRADRDGALADPPGTRRCAASGPPFRADLAPAFALVLVDDFVSTAEEAIDHLAALAHQFTAGNNQLATALDQFKGSVDQVSGFAGNRQRIPAAE